jgi:ABC-type arginine/histidine transport system permease subunit
MAFEQRTNYFFKPLFSLTLTLTLTVVTLTVTLTLTLTLTVTQLLNSNEHTYQCKHFQTVCTQSYKHWLRKLLQMHTLCS